MGEIIRRKATIARRLASIGIAALSIGSASTAALMPVMQASAAPGISVFVGYADNARVGGEFPSPWADSSKVIFDGCKAPLTCTFDAGALRVRNDNSSPVMVDQVSVHIGTCLYTWTGSMYPVTLAPSTSLVTTQRGAGAHAGCTGPDPSSFDSSDITVANNCIPNAILPTVDVTVDGVTTSYTDSGQVLNTGGIDPPGCTGIDESTQWVRIGERPCPGQTLTLSPPSQTAVVTTAASVSANYANVCGSPLSDVLVDFQVTAGPNAGAVGSAITDVGGLAVFTYSSLNVGTDSLVATTTNAVGFTRTSNSVTVTWVVEFAPGGGAFVIGDRNAVIGNTVNFWGAQWAKKNSLSGGPAPRSFKGFAEEPSVPDCGASWTADPGNSTPPPRGPLPDLMAVIVTSSAHKSGPEISGNIVAIVIVRTNPGYAPNPGHSATGTVVAVLCGQLAAVTSTLLLRPNTISKKSATKSPTVSGPAAGSACVARNHGQQHVCSRTKPPAGKT